LQAEQSPQSVPAGGKDGVGQPVAVPLQVTAGSQIGLAPAIWQTTVLAAGTGTQVPISPSTLQ
jgi:hypothetical protein